MAFKSKKNTMFCLAGTGVSPGLAKGRAFVYIDVLQRDSERYLIDHTQVDEEKKNASIWPSWMSDRVWSSMQSR